MLVLQKAWGDHKKCHKVTNAWMYVTNRGQVCLSCPCLCSLLPIGGLPKCFVSNMQYLMCCSQPNKCITVMQKRSATLPRFDWTGPLRPELVGPTRQASVMMLLLHCASHIADREQASSAARGPSLSTDTPLLVLLSFCALCHKRAKKTSDNLECCVIWRMPLQIPESIPRPDYANDGIPQSELQSRQQHTGAQFFSCITQSMCYTASIL